jgi:glycosyltransferase involved in cell wall biosynthesis
MPEDRFTARRRERTAVAYVLKAYPRLSETYIHSEIYRLEKLGLRLRLYAIKPPESTENAMRHPVVDRIRAVPVYLPPVTSVSSVSLAAWLRANLRPFLAPLARVTRRWPLGLARAGAAALAQSVRARDRALAPPRKVYLKELLQAVALSDHLRESRDVRHLHAHYAHGSTTVAWFASLITGIPFSFTAHAKDVYSDELNPAGLLRRKLTTARFAVTCTGAGAEHLRAIAAQARVHVVYHGLNDDLARLAERAPRNGSRNGSVRLLGVGRLVEKKGFDVLVEACAELRRRDIPFAATIAGPDGPHGPAIRELIAEHGLEEAFRLAGPLSQRELFDEYTRADALCLPCRVVGSDRDGIPNVLVEAMACGTPVVTTGISGIPELVSDGINGLLVEPDDSAALASAITRLGSDRRSAERLGSAGRATVRERFDGDRLAGRLAELFRAELER